MTAKQPKPEFRYHCLRCGYKWNPKALDVPEDYKPRQCPNCKQPRWDVPAHRPQGRG